MYSVHCKCVSCCMFEIFFSLNYFRLHDISELLFQQLVAPFELMITYAYDFKCCNYFSYHYLIRHHLLIHTYYTIYCMLSMDITYHISDYTLPSHAASHTFTFGVIKICSRCPLLHADATNRI
jgi:hypothetical protein